MSMRQRDMHKNRRSLAGCGLDVEFSADQHGSLAHAHQSQARAAGVRGDVAHDEAAAVILDDQHCPISPVFQQDADMPCGGVLHDVVQRLLSQPVEIGFGVRREPELFRPRSAKLRGNVEPFRPAADQMGKRGGQSQLV